MSSYGGRPPPRAGILPRLLRFRLLPEQGVHEGLRVEDLEVVDLLADPDQLDRYPQLLVDPDRDAALGGAVELGQLVHEVGLGVQAPRRVHQQHVHITRRGCLHRVEDHRGRVGARDLVDDVHLDPAAPLLELLDSRRAKGVGGGDQHPLTVGLEPSRHLRGAGGLARPVDAQHEDDGGMGVEDERRGRAREGVLEEAMQGGAHVLGGDGAAPLDLVPNALDEGARRGRSQIRRDQGLLELLQHRLVHRTGDGEDGPQALVHQLEGAPQSLPDALPEGAEQAHDPEAGAWGSSSRWITVPFGPSGGRTLPFRASSTPPALPMVTRKRRSADHSRLAPAGSSSSVARPSSGWTRIQVGSTALIRRRCGPGLLLTTAGAGVGAGVAAGLLAGVAGGWATARVGAGAATGRGASPGGVTGPAGGGAWMERGTGTETSIFGAATEVPPVRFTVRLITISAMPRITRRASPTSTELLAHVVRGRGGAFAAWAAARSPARAS